LPVLAEVDSFRAWANAGRGGQFPGLGKPLHLDVCQVGHLGRVAQELLKPLEREPVLVNRFWG